MIKPILLTLSLALVANATAAEDRDATDIVKAAVNHWRGLSSDAVMTMVIHRPDWERTMTMRAWTKGDDRSLVRVLEPRHLPDLGQESLTSRLLAKGVSERDLVFHEPPGQQA